MNKRCAICKEIKPLTEFHMMKGKRRSQCKSCRKIMHKDYYEENKEHVIQRTTKYRKEHPEVGIKSYKKWRRSERGIQFFRNYVDKPEKVKARKAINHAVEYGRMPRVTTKICYICNTKQANHYHHHKGYDKEHWLDVIPVCAKCHGEIKNK